MTAKISKPRAAPVRSASAKAAAVRDPQVKNTRNNILKAATKVFARYGYEGGSVEKISSAAKSFDRMIYYYFGSKEGLYLAVLEESYRKMRQIEGELQLDDLEPEQALRTLVEFTFDHHRSNEDYIRLVMNENIERGAYLMQSKTIRELNVPAIQAIERLYARGLKSGVFRAGVDPVDIHASISALSFFNVSNRHSFGLIFKAQDPQGEAGALRRASVTDMVLRFVGR